jgi:hypothetical protein
MRLENYPVNTEAMAQKIQKSQRTSLNCAIAPADTKCPGKAAKAGFDTS